MYGSSAHSGSAWFELKGYNETIAGLTGGNVSYVRNMAVAPSVLTLAGSGTYSLAASTFRTASPRPPRHHQERHRHPDAHRWRLQLHRATTLTAGVVNLAGGNGGFASPVTFNGGTFTHSGTGYRTVSAIATVAAQFHPQCDQQRVPATSCSGTPGSPARQPDHHQHGRRRRRGEFPAIPPARYSGAMTVNGGQLGISSGAGWSWPIPM